MRRDTYFNARVNDASWDESAKRWTIKTKEGHVASAKYLILGAGLLHRANVPDFPGLNDYQGQVFHSAAWDEEFSPKGKKIAIIGAGSTGVQLTESLGKMADEIIRLQSGAPERQVVSVEEQISAMIEKYADFPQHVPVEKSANGKHIVSKPNS